MFVFKYRVASGFFLSVLCGAMLLSNLGCAQAQEPLVKADGGLHNVRTPSYAATIDAQGALPSFKIGDQEFFKAEAGIPRGAYLYQDGPLRLNDIERPAPDTVSAKSPQATVRYVFTKSAVTINLANQTEKGMTYYIVLDPAVDTVFDNGGNALHPFINQGGQQTTTWFAGKNKLKIEGGDMVSGPWNEKFQLWGLNLEPKKTRTVTLSASQATADDLVKIAAAPANPNLKPKADVASPKLGGDGKISQDFVRAHRENLNRIQQGPIDLLFIGDSITNRWRTVNSLWDERFGAYHPANFGIEGDRTEHVLWRFENGELDGIKPKVVVLLIGTNNMDYPADEIVKGDSKIVAEIHRRLPETKVLLVGILPRSPKPTDPVRAKIKSINTQLAKLDDGDKTRFLDIGDKLLDADGNLTKELAPDSLHLSPQAYRVWADAMQPLINEMME
ncbi:MAG: hypothetical protein EOP10_14325 [Proteobacteria bacterium]|nr:MAG: hypothetical protein EOP10_14325 [Pseudomonadota bacterium]